MLEAAILDSVENIQAGSSVPMGGYCQFPASAPNLITQGTSQYLLNGSAVDYEAKYLPSITRAPWINHDALTTGLTTDSAITHFNAIKVGTSGYVISGGTSGIHTYTSLNGTAFTEVTGTFTQSAALATDGTYVCRPSSTSGYVAVGIIGSGAWGNIPATAIAGVPTVILYGPSGWFAAYSMNATPSEYATKVGLPGNAAWTLRNAGSNILQTLLGGVVVGSNYFVYGKAPTTNFASVYKSTTLDAGSWTPVYTTPYTANPTGFTYTGTTYLLSDDAGHLFSSTNLTTWGLLATAPTGLTRITSLSSNGAGVVAICGLNGSDKVVTVSTDHGATWTAITGTKDVTWSYSAVNAPSIIFTGNGAECFVASNYANSLYSIFKTESSAINTSRWVGATEVSTVAPGKSYVRIL
jgi:hypothetical protein